MIIHFRPIGHVENEFDEPAALACASGGVAHTWALTQKGARLMNNSNLHS
jgi:hypothetical protein